MWCASSPTCRKPGARCLSRNVSCGDSRGADEAQARYLGVAIQDPILLEAGAALAEGKLAVAEHRLRDLLRVRPERDRGPADVGGNRHPPGPL